MANGRFEGKRVLVMGSGIAVDGYDDIGRASALAFARDGAHVVTVQANKEAAAESAAEIRDAGGTAHPYVVDPREALDLEDLKTEVASRWDALDVLVTSHFGVHFGSSFDTDVSTFEQILRVNVTAPFLATIAFTPLLAKGTDPAVVHVSSIDGTYGNPNVPAYSASKGATNALIHVLAAELSSRGIRVNGIARAASTAMPIPEIAFASLADATPLVRAADPAEYAKSVLFLASPDASYITGAILPVDGGRTAVTPGTSPRYGGYQAYHAGSGE